MFFIWRGWGWLVVVGTFLLLLILQLAVEAMGGTYKGSDVWPSVGLILGGACNVVVGRRLNSQAPRVLIDEQTQERVEVKPRHDLFFIRMEWWGAAILVAGTLLLLNGVRS